METVTNSSPKTTKDIFSYDKKSEIVKKIIEEEFDNKELINKINEVFVKKGLSIKFVESLFSEDLGFFELGDEIIQIAFIDGCNQALKWENLDLDFWFSDNSLMSYKFFINTKPIVDTLEFPLSRKIDDRNYLTYIYAEQDYEYLTNGLMPYNTDTQRKATYKKLGKKTNNVIRIPTINKKAVDEIAELMKQGKYEEDMIILNVLLTGENDEIQFEATPNDRVDGICDIVIKPNHNIKDELHYTVVNPLDGYHRIKALAQAYAEYLDETGEKLTCGLPVKVVLRTVEEAKEIVRLSFKRTDTGKDWLKTLKYDDYNKFVNELIKKSKILKNKVTSTYEEYKLYDGMLTYTGILRDTIEKCTTIKVNSINSVASVVPKLAKTIDGIFDCLLENYFNNDMKRLINSRFFADVNIFVGYLAVAYELLDVLDDLDKAILINKICEKLYNADKDEIKNLGLGKSKINVKNLFAYFTELTKEVKNNE